MTPKAPNTPGAPDPQWIEDMLGVDSSPAERAALLLALKKAAEHEAPASATRAGDSHALAWARLQQFMHAQDAKPDADELNSPPARPTRPAANEPNWRPTATRWAAAASIVVISSLLWFQPWQSATQPPPGMDSYAVAWIDSPPSVARGQMPTRTFVVNDPRAQAQRLARELRSTGIAFEPYSQTPDAATLDFNAPEQLESRLHTLFSGAGLATGAGGNALQPIITGSPVRVTFRTQQATKE
jgi:hypothetical protein